VVEGTVYTYFDSKLSLLYRVILEFYEPLIADVERSMQRVSGIRNRIRFVIWRQLVAFIEEPEICYLVIRQLHSSARSYDTFVVDLARRYTAVSVRLVNDGIESGEFRPGISPLLIRSVIYGSIENLYWRLLYRDQEIDAERMADEIADVVFSGIAAENAHKQSVQPSDSALLQALLSEALQEIRRLNENLEKLRQESSDI
jgi:TetR/AcrR family transcriptional regulator, fatty acid metabolism regulator protein